MPNSDSESESDQNESQTVACRLPQDAQQQRKANTGIELIEKTETIEEHEDGYSLTYSGTETILEMVCAFIQSERDCCPFLRFELDVAPDGGPIRLHLSGPDGSKELIESVL